MQNLIPDATEPVAVSDFLDLRKNLVNMDSIVPQKYLGKEAFGCYVKCRALSLLLNANCLAQCKVIRVSGKLIREHHQAGFANDDGIIFLQRTGIAQFEA